MFGLTMELEPKIMHNLLLQTPETERAAGEWWYKVLNCGLEKLWTNVADVTTIVVATLQKP